MVAPNLLHPPRKPKDDPIVFKYELNYNLPPIISKAQFEAIIPEDIRDEQHVFMIKDSQHDVVLAGSDGIDFWYTKLKKAN